MHRFRLLQLLPHGPSSGAASSYPCSSVVSTVSLFNSYPYKSANKRLICSSGILWSTESLVTNARTLGPYCTVLVTYAGYSPPCACPQHSISPRRCSVISSQLRQVEHLAFAYHAVWLVRTNRPPAKATLLRQMHDRFVRLLHRPQGFSFVTRLPAWGALLPFGQGWLYALLPIPVTRRRLVAVAAVHLQTAAQFGIFCLQTSNFGAQFRILSRAVSRFRTTAWQPLRGDV